MICIKYTVMTDAVVLFSASKLKRKGKDDEK